jgi:hypothetical protein
MTFVLCSACNRHVRDTDTACPFCGAAAFRAAPVARIRRSRGSLLAVGVVASLAGCSDADGRTGEVIEAVPDAGPDACTDDVEDASVLPGPDAEVSIPIYDAVPPIPSTDE